MVRVSELLSAKNALLPTMPEKDERGVKQLIRPMDLRDNRPRNALALSPDGKSLVTAGADRTVKFWDPVTGQERLTRTGTRAILGLAFAPDNRTLAVHWQAELGDRYVPETATLYRAARP